MLKRNWKSIGAAFVSFSVVTILGAIFVFRPIESADSVNGELIHPAFGVILYLCLSIALFDWIARQLGNAYKAAFIIAAAQFILVNVDFVIRGERGLMTAGASTLLMIITWAAAAFAYNAFSCDD